MPTVSRRAVLASGVIGAALAPGRLLAAVEAATPSLPSLDSWPRVRSMFSLAPDWLHFSGFYHVSHPAPVREAIEGFRRAIDANPFLVIHQGHFGSEAENLQQRVRVAAAAYLGGAPDEVALTHSTTMGLALVHHGIPLKPGDEVLTTRHDHVAHHESIRLAAERSGATVRKIALFDASATATAGGIVERVRDALRPETRVLALTWVHSQSGLRIPARDIARVVAETNRSRSPDERILFVLDGVHGLGCVDEAVADLGADYFCAGTHKWIFGPRGTGLVWARADRWALLRQTLPAGADREPFKAWAEGRLPSTPNNARRMTPGGFPAWEHQWGLASAFQLSTALGRGRVAARVAELNGRLKERLAAIPRVTLHTPRDPALSAGICCFEVAGKTPAQVVEALLGRKVVASTSPYAVQYARLSAGIFNTPEECDRAVAAVRATVA